MSFSHEIDYAFGYETERLPDYGREETPRTVVAVLREYHKEARQKRFEERIDGVAAVVMTAETQADWEKLAAPSFGE